MENNNENNKEENNLEEMEQEEEQEVKAKKLATEELVSSLSMCPLNKSLFSPSSFSFPNISENNNSNNNNSLFSSSFSLLANPKVEESSSHSKCCLLDLPPELHTKILMFLDPEDVLSYSRTCRTCLKCADTQQVRSSRCKWTIFAKTS